MKYSLTAAALALATAHAATAATPSAPTVWQGEIFITSATSTCGSSTTGTHVGDFFQAIFAPKNLPGNGPRDEMNIFFARGAAFHLEPQNGTLNGATAFNMAGIYHDGTNGTGVQLSQGPISVSPSTITSATPTVTISSAWKSFAGESGCNVTFQGSLTRRPGKLTQ